MRTVCLARTRTGLEQKESSSTGVETGVLPSLTVERQTTDSMVAQQPKKDLYGGVKEMLERNKRWLGYCTVYCCSEVLDHHDGLERNVDLEKAPGTVVLF